MNIIAVDDEKLALESLQSSILKAAPYDAVFGFRNAEQALSFVRENPCDVAFLDIELRDMNGIDLAREISSIHPQVNIIFTTGYSDYTGQAFELHASGYIMKPVTEEKVQKEMEVLRYAVSHAEEKLLKVRTFGNFEVFKDNQPLNFRYNKTKELLAYLVNCGGSLCSNNEIICTLWDDEHDVSSHISYMKNVRGDLLKALEDVGAEDIIVRQRGKLGVRVEKLDCDLYGYMQGDPEMLKRYHGEYMNQYSWGEYEKGKLDNRL
ncbi:Two-component response regulator, SAPR family, consists of REC, wHTH and BTAD domains [Lachnospiraceae bacterium A10]|nr:Two-component response regulator, SAPR family, consists of REC, wHTH and BTAD domains [Lachnospiraceae bacterium A10]